MLSKYLLQTVTELRNRHAKGETSAGINVRKGAITDILEENVVQPLLVSTSALSFATETVRSILKIDDIVSRIFINELVKLMFYFLGEHNDIRDDYHVAFLTSFNMSLHTYSLLYCSFVTHSHIHQNKTINKNIENLLLLFLR